MTNQFSDDVVREALRRLRLPAQNTVFRDRLVENVIALLLAERDKKDPITLARRNPHHAL
ncbi:hypothetical protein WT72_22830 [Burkholderia pseudomultivorans]|nr:hypothetical protein WT72_22830 [Burkholderia pseudomultivorans]